ncbi:MAG: CSLREA domain-containing protein, partial [Anaerolineae bacterium]
MNILIFNRSNFRYLIFTSLFLLAMAMGSFAHADEGDFYFTVNSTADLSDINPGDEICEASNGLCTLRAAIEEGNVVSDGNATEITVPAGTYLINSQLVATDVILIKGAGKGATIIDGQGTTAVLHVHTPTADEMLVCDQSGRSVIRYNDNGQPIEDFINHDGHHSTWWPTAIDVGPNGNVFVATKISGVFEFRQSGFQLDRFITYKDFPWDNINLNIVDGIFAPSPARGYFVVDQLQKHEIVRFNETDGQKVIYRINGQQELKKPDSLAFYNDDLFVSDIESNNVQKYNALTGAFIEIFVDQAPNGLDNPRGLVFKNDILYVASEGSDSVLRFDAQTGSPLGAFIPSGSGGLDAPHDISFGPNGDFYVLSKNTNEILRYDGTTGAFKDVFIQTDNVYLEDPACFKWYEKILDTPYVNLYDLTIQNGFTQNPNEGSAGLHVDQGATVNLRNVMVQNNISAFEGGGIYNKGKMRIDDSDILNNSIPFNSSGDLSRGGGIFNAAELGIYNS